jgi:hypothetical protein
LFESGFIRVRWLGRDGSVLFRYLRVVYLYDDWKERLMLCSFFALSVWLRGEVVLLRYLRVDLFV